MVEHLFPNSLEIECIHPRHSNTKQVVEMLKNKKQIKKKTQIKKTKQKQQLKKKGLYKKRTKKN
jgi:hypothetical protein